MEYKEKLIGIFNRVVTELKTSSDFHIHKSRNDSNSSYFTEKIRLPLKKGYTGIGIEREMYEGMKMCCRVFYENYSQDLTDDEFNKLFSFCQTRFDKLAESEIDELIKQ